MEILEDKPGKKILLLGNEAIARGALEAGVDIATTYPGTPSSEIADTFSFIAKSFTKKNKNPGFFFEYSTNEKVALEIAAAASITGLRSLTCMKHVQMTQVVILLKMNRTIVFLHFLEVHRCLSLLLRKKQKK